MVQIEDAGLCKCTTRNGNLNQIRPFRNSKFSTVNYKPHETSNNNINETVNIPRFPIYSHHPNKSYWEKCSASSCIVGFMKFIQHHCNTRKRNHYDYRKQVVIVHGDLMDSMKQLKCDLQYITELQQKHGNLCIKNGDENIKCILSRMAFKLYEIENRLMKSNAPTCSELLTRRKTMLQLLKTVQGSIACYLRCEIEGLKHRQIKLCNLLRYLQCIENEFRCMTNNIKSQCCNNNIDNQTEKKSQINSIACKKKKSIKQLEGITCKNLKTSKNYDIIGIDVVYTKCTIKTLESENTRNEIERIEEEVIDKKVSCHIPVNGEPICEIKINDGKDTYKLCDSENLKTTLCQMSNIWYESARQLIDVFHTC